MYSIGILQLTQNLDDAVKGFRRGLAQAGIEAQFTYVNADGNVDQLPALAAQLAQASVDLIFACSTPAAKAAIALPDQIPVVFTPVFDPVGAGLVDCLKRPGGKATGMAGMVSAKEKVALIGQVLPAAKKIGMLYHTADANSLVEAANFAKAAQGRFELTPLTITVPEDLSHLQAALECGLDALFIPIGKIVEENFATVIYYTDLAQLPVIASHAPNVPAGAVAALTASHSRLGEACARQALQILQGAQPADIPVGIVDQPELLINQFAAGQLNIGLPDALLAAAAQIYE